MILTGAYERTIDAKNRIQIPSPAREALGGPTGVFFIVPGERANTLAFFPEAYFEAKVASMGTDEIAGQDALDFEQTFFSLASRVEMDKQGRVVLPERQLAMVQIGTEVYLTGAYYRLDLWRKSDYEAFIAEAASRRATVQAFMRMGRRGAARPDERGSG